jgi:hypothetical protein
MFTHCHHHISSITTAKARYILSISKTVDTHFFICHLHFRSDYGGVPAIRQHQGLTFRGQRPETKLRLFFHNKKKKLLLILAFGPSCTTFIPLLVCYYNFFHFFSLRVFSVAICFVEDCAGIVGLLLDFIPMDHPNGLWNFAEEIEHEHHGHKISTTTTEPKSRRGA